MATNPARQNAKVSATPANMVQAGFSIPSVANSNSAPKNKIVGLATNKTPEQITSDNEARKRSLASDTPNYKPNEEASKNLAQGQLEELLDLSKLRDPESTNLLDGSHESDGPNEDQNMDKSVDEQEIYDDTYNNQPAGGTYSLPDPYERCLTELKDEGYNFTRSDVDTFKRSNFKVKVPISYIVIGIFNFLSSIVLGLMGILMTLAGFSANALGWASAIFTFGAGIAVGEAVGGVATLVGVAISMISFFTNITLSICSIVAQIFYLKSASVVMRKGGILKKHFSKLLRIRIFLILFGWIPLLNGIIFIAGGRSFWRLAKHETEKVEKIVKKHFPN